MINSSLKEKYWDSGTDKQMVISIVGTNQKIDNSMLEVGTFALEESICSESELKFGACEANSVKFTARNTAGSRRTKMCMLYLGILKIMIFLEKTLKLGKKSDKIATVA